MHLDFQKAFDKIPHKRLVSKMKVLGIDGMISNWTMNWLSDTEPRVVLLGNNSHWIKIKSGVPQGPVLGPLLFLIYINDTDESVNGNLLKFADDTKVFRIVANQTDIVKLQDLRNSCKWYSDWLMLFNTEKC